MRENIILHLPRIAAVFKGASIGLLVGCLSGMGCVLSQNLDSLLPFVVLTIFGSIAGGVLAEIKFRNSLKPGAPATEEETGSPTAGFGA